MTHKDAYHYKNNNICRFSEKEVYSDKVKDDCHLTGIYNGLAHNKCNTNVTQKQSNFVPFAFDNFSSYDCQLLFNNLNDKKNDKVKLDNILETNEKKMFQ